MTDTCEKHCEATAFKIVIRGLEGEVARLVAAKTWVGLTDEDRLRLWLKTEAEDVDRYAFAKAIEAKLKEKNT